MFPEIRVAGGGLKLAIRVGVACQLAKDNRQPARGLSVSRRAALHHLSASSCATGHTAADVYHESINDSNYQKLCMHIMSAIVHSILDSSCRCSQSVLAHFEPRSREGFTA